MSPLTRRDFLTGSALVAAGGLVGCASGTKSATKAKGVGAPVPQGIGSVWSPRRRRRSAITSSGPLLTPNYSVASSCTLAEDYLLVDPQAASSATEKVMSFQVAENTRTGTPVNSRTHTIVMTTGTGSVPTLSHVRPNSSSPGGFSAAPIPNTVGVTDFVVSNIPQSESPLNVPGGVIELFCLKSASVDVYQLATDGATWRAMDTLAWFGRLQVDYFDWPGFGVLVYAWDHVSGQIFWRMTDGVTPTTGVLSGVTSLAGNQLAMGVLYQDASHGIQFVIVAGLQGFNQIGVWNVAAATGSVGRPQFVPLPSTASTVESVQGIDSNHTDAFAIIRDSAGDLYTFVVPTSPSGAGAFSKIWDHTQFATPTERGQADSVTPMQVYPAKGAPLLDLLVLSGGTGWLLHQSPASSTASPVFAPPIPFVSDVSSAAIALTPAQADARTIVTVDAAGAVAILTQPASDQPWSGQAVLLEGSSAEPVDTYRVQLSLTDANGIPVIDTQLSVTADSPVLALTDSGSQLLGTTATTFTTDSHGRVVLALVADGLSAPTITVSGTNITTSTVSPAHDIQAFLAGTGTLHHADYTLTPGNLQSADGSSGPLAPGLSTADAGTAVALMTTAMTTGLGHPPTVGRRERLQLGTLAGPPQGPVRVGNLEFSLNDFGADIWHAIKSGAATVDTVIHDTANVIHKIGLTIKGWGSVLIDCVVNTIEDAVHAAHSIFNHIKAAIDDAIAWLREGVTAILHDAALLATAMSGWLSEAPAFVSKTATSYKGKADTFFSTLKSDLQSQLDAVPDLSLADLVDKAKSGGLAGPPPRRRRRHKRRHHHKHPRPVLGSSPLANLDPAAFTSNNHASWLLHKILADLKQSIPQSDNQQLQKLNQQFLSSIENSSQTFESALQTFWTGLLPSDAKNAKQEFSALNTQTITAGLVGLVDALLSLTNVAADALLDVIIEVCSVLEQDVFNATLGELPLVGSLLKNTSLGGLTFGKLICIIIAFPVAVIYQLVNGVGAPPLADLLQQSSLSTRPNRRSRRAGAPVVDASASTVLTWLAAGAQGVWAFFDVILDVASVATPLTSAVDIITPIVISTVTCPGTDAPYVNVPLDTNGERMQFAGWISGFLPPLASAALYLDPTEEKTLRNTHQGPMLITGFGLYIMIYGIIANGVDHADVNWGNWVATICGGLTVMDGVLGSDDVIKATDEISLVVKVISDFFCGIGAAVGFAMSE